ncbi:unnamed protein product [Cuscuta europaea]|uniref:SPRY domain-containing protein n=1 Tax=Cuscuta europaea TaxID=41803 RepID=A0A9P0YIT9_CUSEU|nr:unnamed protein product [Cuscuta europaea]
MASSKRKSPTTDEVVDSQIPKLDATAAHVQPSLTAHLPPVALNPADCELDFDIENNGLQGSALYRNAFAWCWSGARANVGITGGKYCFGCKVISDQPVSMVYNTQDGQHLCRIGVSWEDDPVGDLGESLHSFCFEATGDTYTAGSCSEYGESFGVGDKIICCLDLENSNNASIGFFKNSKWLGVAKQFEDHPNWRSAFFPHILLKNVVVRLQFSVEDGLDVVEGYKPWASALEDEKAFSGPTFSDVHCYEFIMLVGLPASGKSTWAEKRVKDYPGKRYIVIGKSLMLDKMKVPGLTRKYGYGEMLGEIFNTLLSRASKLPRNFILDKMNLNKIDRKCELKSFSKHKKIAVVIFPALKELKMRSDKQFQEMRSKVNFSLPTSKDMPCTDEYFDEVIFPEQGREEAQRCLDLMKAHIHSGQPTNLAPHPRPEEAIYINPAAQYDPGSSSVQ